MHHTEIKISSYPHPHVHKCTGMRKIILIVSPHGSSAVTSLLSVILVNRISPVEHSEASRPGIRLSYKQHVNLR